MNNQKWNLPVCNILNKTEATTFYNMQVAASSVQGFAELLIPIESGDITITRMPNCSIVVFKSDFNTGKITKEHYLNLAMFKLFYGIE